VKVSAPRLIVVTRPSPVEALMQRHGTKSQAKFYLESRKQRFEPVAKLDAAVQEGLAVVLGALPPDWRRVRVDRADLDRFVFRPDDVVVVVGQDGLVANVAKYLEGQLCIGVNPDPKSYDGVLCSHAPRDVGAILRWVERRDPALGFVIQARPLVLGQREDGQKLYALNELFIGHRTHQSARYTISTGGRRERHSSSGLIVCTGTGATGWARSMNGQRAKPLILPSATDPSLAYFVREPFPSVATGVELDGAALAGDQELEVVSEMSEGGVIFGDGIESDAVDFLTGQTVSVRVADRSLQLVIRSAG
jgi:NAD kinase